jgi:hypothetical protein
MLVEETPPYHMGKSGVGHEQGRNVYHFIPEAVDKPGRVDVG